MTIPKEDLERDLKGRTIRGGFAKICSQAATFTLRIGSMVVMARLLNPRDFGLVGMVIAVTGVLNLFKDFGLSAATVQSATISREQKSNLFWLNILVGFILGLVALAAAPILVSFYNEPRLFWVTVVMAAGFPISAAAGQHYALLERELRFMAVAVIDILSLAIATAVGIGMAVTNFGYWALVGSTVMGSVVSTLGAWMASKWVPGWIHRNVGVRSMVRFGGTITLNGLVVYVAYNLEKVLLGRFWGAAALGIYGRAYQLINIPTENLNSSIGGVAFSALSRVQDDPDRLKKYFLKGYSLILSLTLPITIVCALLADDMILVLLGPKWMEAVPVFRWLTPTILIFALINPFSWLLFSLGLVGRSLKIAFVIAPLVITAYIIGLPHGPKGVALAYSAAMTVWVIPHIAWCVHGTMISLEDIFRAVGRPFLSAITAALLAFGVIYFCGPWLPPILRLLVGGGVLFLTYALMLLYVMGQKPFYLDLIRGLKKPSSIDDEEPLAAVMP